MSQIEIIFEEIANFAQLCAILGSREQSAAHYGRINAELGRLGRLIPQNDTWITAIAMGHNLALATRDEHFSMVPGLKLPGWQHRC